MRKIARMHWTVVCLLSFLTLGLFIPVYMWAAARYIRDLDGSGPSVVFIILWFVCDALAQLIRVVNNMHHNTLSVILLVVGFGFSVFLILDFVSHFKERGVAKGSVGSIILAVLFSPIYIPLKMRKLPDLTAQSETASA